MLRIQLKTLPLPARMKLIGQMEPATAKAYVNSTSDEYDRHWLQKSWLQYTNGLNIDILQNFTGVEADALFQMIIEVAILISDYPFPDAATSSPEEVQERISDFLRKNPSITRDIMSVVKSFNGSNPLLYEKLTIFIIKEMQNLEQVEYEDLSSPKNGWSSMMMFGFTEVQRRDFFDSVINRLEFTIGAYLRRGVRTNFESNKMQHFILHLIHIYEGKISVEEELSALQSTLQDLQDHKENLLQTISHSTNNVDLQSILRNLDDSIAQTSRRIADVSMWQTRLQALYALQEPHQ